VDDRHEAKCFGMVGPGSASSKDNHLRKWGERGGGAGRVH
jgi:hypothetical protein